MGELEYKFKNKQVTMMIIGVAILVIGLISITYAFFNYTKTGTANIVKVGQVNFATNQTENINLLNTFPISRTQAATDATYTDEAIITITGDTNYSDGVEYLVTATGVVNTLGTGVSAKTVPISIIITPSNGLGSADANYFSNRGALASGHIYKVLSGNKIESDGRILVGYIKSGSTGINGSLTIRAYLDEDEIAISDTYIGPEATPNDDLGTPTEFGEGKTVLTTTEWNNLRTAGVSFKVKIEAQEGTWVTQ